MLLANPEPVTRPPAARRPTGGSGARPPRPPVVEALQVDRRRRRHVLQAGLGQADVPARRRPNPRTPCDSVPSTPARTAYSRLPLRRLLLLPGRLQRHGAPPAAAASSRGPSWARAQRPARAGQALGLRRTRMWITRCPSGPGGRLQRTLVLPSRAGHRPRLPVDRGSWAMSNAVAGARLPADVRGAGPTSRRRARTGCSTSSRPRRSRRRPGDRPAADPSASAAWMARSGPRPRSRPASVSTCVIRCGRRRSHGLGQVDLVAGPVGAPLVAGGPRGRRAS